MDVFQQGGRLRQWPRGARREIREMRVREKGEEGTGEGRKGSRPTSPATCLRAGTKGAAGGGKHG